jgi:bifunctional DNA-binding transcriptional regulator/antitoxin component of YhaV-PrlF toxin-antitoxin module
MDRAFETTIDSQGHFDIPIDVRDRHGLTNGARVKIEENGNRVVISPVESHIEIEDISDLAGFLKKGNPVGDLLRERALDREREDADVVVPKVFDKAAARWALEKAVGFMGTDGAGLKALMEERRRERDG